MKEMKNSGVEWIGQIPINWNIVPIKSLSNNEENSFIDGDWIESHNISDKGIRYLTTGNIGDGQYKSQGDSFISISVFNQLNCKFAYPGDLIFSRLNAPYGRSCILSNDENEYVLAVDNVILRTDNDKRYICYVTQCDGYHSSVEDKCAGTTMKRISRGNLGRIKIPLPLLDAQHLIADYLDSKCSKIDAIIEREQAVIDKLKEYKLSVITEAVTKGLNPDVEMKDSGVEWIGTVPEHWKIFRIANLYHEVSESGNPSLPILTVSINTGVSDRELSAEESDRVFARSEDRSKYKCVQPGDLTYNMMRAWQGAFGAVRVDGMVSPAYVVARPFEEIDSRYAEFLLRTPAAIEEMHRYSHGVTDFRLRLYWPEFRNIRICFPPLAEQKKIVDAINTKSERIDADIIKREKLIAKLTEYKKSLIYEVVTGKKEV